MTNILVTGANGYIGSHIVSLLLKKNYQDKIIAVDFEHNHIPGGAICLKYDILKNADNTTLYDDLQRPDTVLHLAWQDGFNHNAESHMKCLSSHFVFIKNLIDNGAKHISIAGSFREYGKCCGKVSEEHACSADTFYSLAKLTLKQAIELYIKNKNICFQWLRFFTPYGNDKLNNSILSKILKWDEEGKDTFPFTDGSEQYDYIHIDELSRQVVAVINQRLFDGAINICSGKPTSLKEIVENFISQNALKIKPDYGAFPCRSYDSPIIYGDNTKINRIMD